MKAFRKCQHKPQQLLAPASEVSRPRQREREKARLHNRRREVWRCRLWGRVVSKGRVLAGQAGHNDRMFSGSIYRSLRHIPRTVSPHLAINCPTARSLSDAAMSDPRNVNTAESGAATVDISKKPNPLSADLFSKLSAVPKPPDLQTKIRQHVNPLSSRCASMLCCVRSTTTNTAHSLYVGTKSQ